MSLEKEESKRFKDLDLKKIRLIETSKNALNYQREGNKWTKIGRGLSIYLFIFNQRPRSNAWSRIDVPKPFLLDLRWSI